LAAPWFSERSLIRAGATYQNITDWHEREPALPQSEPRHELAERVPTGPAALPNPGANAARREREAADKRSFPLLFSQRPKHRSHRDAHGYHGRSIVAPWRRFWRGSRPGRRVNYSWS